MNLPAKLAQTGMWLRQGWDLWWGGYAGAGGSSVAIGSWDAAKGGDRLQKWWPPLTDFSTILAPGLLKRRARDAERNNPWAHRAVRLLRDYVVGTGIKPMCDVPDAGLRARAQSLWTRWTEFADFNGQGDFYGLTGEAFRSCLIDGEVLAVIRPGPALQVQLLASEFLDYSRDNAVDIMGGIQYNEAGQRLGYWLYEKNPAQPLNPVSTFVPADRVIHMFAPVQPGFQRGSSWLAPALVPLFELQGFMEASLVRARAGSLFCGYVRSADGTPFLVNDQNEPVFEPGSMARLRPGDELTFTTPPDPTQGYTPFINTQLRAIASALSLPYELLTGDLGQITFASGREGLLAFQTTCDAISQNLVAFQWCRPIWRWWSKIMVASGQLPEAVLEAPVRWVAPPIETLDSRMAAQSTIAKIRGGLISRSEVVAGTGVDPEALDRQIAADNARADELKLVYDSDPRRVTLQGLEQPSDAKVQ
jgi:lambda family phage portal protein